ncbi:MAG: sensor histidine kinase [Gemmiger sp.]
MRKKGSGVPLRRLLTGYLVGGVAGCGVLIVVWWLALTLLINRGVVLSAYKMAEVTMEARQALTERTAENFEEALPSICRWALFDAPGGELLDTNMDGWHLKQARNAWQGGSGNLGYTQYHLSTPLADGSVCLLQYDYAVHYANAALDRVLPDFQLCWLLLLAAAWLGWVWLLARRAGNRITADLALLKTESDRFRGAADGDLERRPAQGKAAIREFGEVQQAMEGMRAGLADALKARWRMEQQRAEQTAALAHDLKTPLTVIAGNAELLCEETLTDGQRRCAGAILRGEARAEEYLDRLRELSAADLQKSRGTAKKTTDAAELWWQVAQAARDLCAAKRIALTVQPAPGGICVAGDGQTLLRALENLLQNALRYTPEGGRIGLELRRGEGTLGFAVRDGGPGFSPAALAQAGTLFYTEDGARDGHQGLGLYFAGTVAEACGGRLEAENTGDGARVTLWCKAWPRQ